MGCPVRVGAANAVGAVKRRGSGAGVGGLKAVDRGRLDV